jgi:hypothetical protein
MTDALKARGRGLTAGVTAIVTLVMALAAVLVAPVAKADGCVSGTLIKGSLPAVYYCGADGKRYVFTNDKAFFTWYADFSGIQVLTDAALGEIAIGGNVTYRPGKKMIKIQSDPKVYVINRGGVLKHVPSEECAETLYGANWKKEIDDVSDSFFVNYQIGTPLATCSDFDKSGEMNVSVSINVDKNLMGGGAIVLPAVTSVSPSAGATNVSIDADVMATFSKKMKASTLSTGTFTLTKSGTGTSSGVVAGAVTYSGQTATFNPSASLEANTAYTATVTTGVKDEADKGMTVDYSWNFTTGATASVSGPSVTSVSPTNGSTSASTTANVTATFNSAMDATSFTNSTFTLKKGGTDVTGTVSASGNTATFNPMGDLEAGATYDAMLTTGVRSASGTAMATGFTWSFTVAGSTGGSTSGATTITAITPPDGGTGVAISTPITLTFSGPMNASTISSSTLTVKKGSTAVAGTVTYTGNVATFTPASPLEANSTYTVTLTAGAKDMGGNSVQGGAYSWNFTTAS